MRRGRLRKEELQALRQNLQEIRKEKETQEESKKTNRLKVYILIAVIVAVIAISGFISLTGKVVAEKGTDKFVKCLSSSGLVLLGSNSCDYCDSLKSSLGESSIYLNYVDCDKDKSRCAETKEYPMWVFNGQQLRSNFTLQELSIITKCIL